MKTPLLKYILLTLVIVIWSVVFYRIYDGVTTPRETLPPKEHQKPVKVIRDSLLLNYRNPFAINTVLPPKIQAPLRAIRQPRTPPKQSKHPSSLDANYLGRVIRDRRVYSILEFQTGQFLLQKGDTMQGVKIIGIFEDSLKVRSSESDYTIVLSK